MKRLSISSTSVNDAVVKNLSKLENLNLEILKLQSCPQLGDDGILALTRFQKNLRVLDIGYCNGVTNQSIISICRNLTNLEELNIQCCRAVTNRGVVELYNLKKLRVLNISQCKVTSFGITNGICLNENRTLNDLDLSQLDLDQDCIMNMSEKFPELLKLNISSCFYAVTDESIQAIFKNQIWLRSLKLSYCTKVSDAGLTGKVNLFENNKMLFSRNDDSPTKVNFETFSLARLRGLIDLDLSGCNQITDVSLKSSFNLKELVSLDLSWCLQITDEGLEFMVENCPSIESLKLKDCYNLKDENIATLTKGLRRLKILNIRGCEQLTNKSLDFIRLHCECLSLLDVRGCGNMSPGLTYSLRAMGADVLYDDGNGVPIPK